MDNDGKGYEQFVANLQQAILNTESITEQKNIKIELNKKIIDNCGVKREFDLYWEYELAGITYKTIIECKDYNSNISLEKIDALIGKIRDIPDLKPIFATKKGYQSGAKKKAEQNKIDLLIVREQNDSDWQDKYGNSLIKLIQFQTKYILPARLIKFEPQLDFEWIKENTKIDPSKPIMISGLNNEIFIKDIDKNKKYSILDLTNELSSLENQKFGSFSKHVKFSNAFICTKDYRLKMIAYNMKYILNEPIKHTFETDFSKELIGVIEYLQKGVKKSIFKDGIIKDNNL